MKNYMTVFIIFFSILTYTPCLAIEQNNINAELFVINFSGQQYCLLVPTDSQKYPIITKNPITFFFFTNNWSANKLNNLKVEQLQHCKEMTGYIIPNYPNLKCLAMGFERIEGFTMTEELKKSDKFTLTEKKSAIINELKRCYNNYSAEYQIYLKDTFRFIVNQPEVYEGERPVVKGFEDISSCYTANAKSNDDSGRNRYSTKNYDIDKQEMKITVFGCDYHNRNMTAGWQIPYEKYNKMKVTSNVTIKIPVDIAKEMFSGGKKVYMDTIVTAKPQRGLVEYRTPDGVFRGWATAMKIIKIDKYFKRNKKDVESIYHVELRPGKGYRF